MNDPVYPGAIQRGFEQAYVGKVEPIKSKIAADLLDLAKPGVLQARIVISVAVVDTDHCLASREQSENDMHSDETGASGDENGHG
jgi:hypothetical protein